MRNVRSVAQADVLVDETAPVHFAESGRNGDGEAEETFDHHRHAEQTAKQFAAGVFEYQRTVVSRSGHHLRD